MSKQIIFLSHRDIDKAQWDQCINQCTNGLIYAQSWYLDIVSPGWAALITPGFDYIMPLTWKKKYGIRYLFQPAFVQQLGIFTIHKDIPDSILYEFISAIPKEYSYLDFFVNHKNQFAENHFSELILQKRLTHHLLLDQDIEKIRKGYSENLLRNIKRAHKNNFAVTTDVSIDEIIRLFQKNRGTEISGMGTKEYNLLRQLARKAQQKNLASMYAVREDKKLHAAALFLKSNQEYIFLFSATSEEGKKTGAMSLLIDSFIQYHENESMLLDFEGSMDKNLSRFYKSFGASEVVYLHVQQNRLPKLIRWLKK
jgi:hypothetical protein